MSRILVVSDSHGDRECLVDLVQRYRGKVDLMCHCGDSELEPTDELWQDLQVVTGNCDFDPQFPKEKLITLDQERIYLAHGHLLNVNQSVANLLYRSQELQATMAFYGHTHKLGVEMLEGVLVLNPGSISQPRGRYQIKTYALITVTEDSYQVAYYDRNHELVPELACQFSKVN